MAQTLDGRRCEAGFLSVFADSSNGHAADFVNCAAMDACAPQVVTEAAALNFAPITRPSRLRRNRGESCDQSSARKMRLCPAESRGAPPRGRD